MGWLREMVDEYRHALHKAESAEAYIKSRAEAGTASEAGFKIDDAIRAMVRPGYYEHFKSTKESRKYYRVYEVLPSVNHDTGPHAYEVIYEALYPPHTGRKTRRELTGPDGFLTPINRESYMCPRFMWVGTEYPSL